VKSENLVAPSSGLLRRQAILGKGICNPKGSPECARNLLLLSSRESRRSKLESVSWAYI